MSINSSLLSGWRVSTAIPSRLRLMVEPDVGLELRFWQ